ARDAKQPFYLHLWTDDPHTPHEPSPANRGDGSVMAMYDGVVKELDRDLGLLFDAIRDDAQLRQNTLIVFASDNGHDPAITASAGLRGHKSNLYEGGIRDPFIVWWPGAHDAGKVGTVNQTTTLAGFDLAPSILHIAGVPIPNGVKFDGQDMSRAYRGEAIAREGSICWLRPPDRPGPGGSFPDLAIRKGAMKLLVEEDGSNAQLFDVMADPTEQRDLAVGQPDRVSEMKAEVLAWRKQMPQPTTKPATN
ncbi:MAG: sulfatase-like hydrolase/transferase, partial [Tepidisphaeraceae bacterium]